MDKNEAAQAVEHSMTRLITEKPFYGFLMSQFRRRHNPDLKGAMGIDIDQEGNINLQYNERFMVAMKDGSKVLDLSDPSKVRPWTAAELDAVHEHQCLHLISSHMTRRQWRDRATFDLASDLAVNSLIKGLPPQAPLPEDLEMPANLSTEAYYDRLEGEGCGSGGGGEDGADGGGQGSEGQEPADGQSNGKPRPSGIDSHEGWGSDTDAGAEMAEDIVKDAVGRAYRRSGERNRAQGYLPAGVLEMIQDLLKQPYDWRPILRRFCMGTVKFGRRSTRFRPHRRYGIAFPGRKPNRAGKVAVLVDTSGSITADDLAQFRAELEGISRFVQVVVVECDAAIQDVYEVQPRTRYKRTHFKGGGGTVFTPVFEAMAGKAATRQHPKQDLLRGAEALIILTDGAATVPATNITGRPVMWALTPGGRRPVDYGMEIYIGDWKDQRPQTA